MKPLKLELHGFEGIFCAFGRHSFVLDLQDIPEEASLVALVGPNGAGKTTILDNLHPYRVMPSHSTTLGPGGFSYWDHLHAPTASKDLLWEHAGTRYHSVLSFKGTGKTRKADSYLYQWLPATESWAPAALADGSLSDGKADTYDRCLDAIMGPPERFFTAQFSSQKRKSIAQYSAGDFKSILASVLNLQHFRDLSAKASLVGKFLRQQLDGMNEEIAEVRSQDNAAAVVTDELRRIELATADAAVSEAAATGVLDAAKQGLAAIVTKRDGETKTAEEIRFLNEQIASAVAKSASTKASLQAQFGREQDGRNAEMANIRNQLAASKQTVLSNETDEARLIAVLGEKAAISLAGSNLPKHQAELQELDELIAGHQSELENAPAVRSKMQQLFAQKATLKSEGLTKSIVIKNLSETAALIDQVPCKGSKHQTACQLLGKANAAATIIPQHEAEQAAKRLAYSDVAKAMDSVQAQLDRFTTVETTIRSLQLKRRPMCDAIDADTRLYAKAPLIADAESRLPTVRETLVQQRRMIGEANARISQLTQALAEAEAAKQVGLADVDAALAAEKKALEDRLGQLPQPVTDAEIKTQQGAVAQANAGLVQVRARISALGEQQVAHLGKLQALEAMSQRSQQVKAQAARLNDEIAMWKLLEKGMGNDGCVALSIDDAGPEIALICNSLLADCFEGRFAVRLDTQRETQTGSLKETFEVKVFDGHRGSEKSLGRMSGGEEVLVNECLTRSIALYASQSSPNRCQTLFTDETDGALDVVAKRTFMKMKRAVVKQGGYDREFFITHTPELWAMADHKIHVAEL